MFSIFFTSHSVFSIFNVRLRVFHILYSAFSIFWRHTPGLRLRDSDSGTPTPELRLRVFHLTVFTSQKPQFCLAALQVSYYILPFLQLTKTILAQVTLFGVFSRLGREAVNSTVKGKSCSKTQASASIFVDLSITYLFVASLISFMQKNTMNIHNKINIAITCVLLTHDISSPAKISHL